MIINFPNTKIEFIYVINAGKNGSFYHKKKNTIGGIQLT